ncbi:MAG: hypothetical protein WBI06_11170 [Paludibacter sp.]
MKTKRTEKKNIFKTQACKVAIKCSQYAYNQLFYGTVDITRTAVTFLAGLLCC